MWCADNSEENVSNVLTPLHRFNPALGVRTRCYWSSKGNRDEESSEWLLLSLVHPLCLVHSVAVRPFRATFQRVRPDQCPTVRARICSAGSISHAAGQLMQPSAPLVKMRVLLPGACACRHAVRASLVERCPP